MRMQDSRPFADRTPPFWKNRSPCPNGRPHHRPFCHGTCLTLPRSAPFRGLTCSVARKSRGASCFNQPRAKAAYAPRVCPERIVVSRTNCTFQQPFADRASRKARSRCRHLACSLAVDEQKTPGSAKGGQVLGGLRGSENYKPQIPASARCQIIAHSQDRSCSSAISRGLSFGSPDTATNVYPGL